MPKILKRLPRPHLRSRLIADLRFPDFAVVLMAGLYVRARGTVHGPFTAERLKELAAAGKIGPDAEISRDQQKWTPAASVKGLFPARQVATPPPPPPSLLPAPPPPVSVPEAVRRAPKSSLGDKLVWGTFAAVVGIALLTVVLGLAGIVHPLFAIIAGILLSNIAYFLPVIIGAYRGVESIVSLAVVNVLLGWTLVGWTVSLAWACAPVRRPPISHEKNSR